MSFHDFGRISLLCMVSMLLEVSMLPGGFSCVGDDFHAFHGISMPQRAFDAFG